MIDTFFFLAHGFSIALMPYNLMWAVVGVVIGTAVGVLPGIGPALTIALLLPVTYGLDAVPSFVMFAGIYYGSMYGGSTTSILLNTPGESASVITAIDGYAMARRGRGAQALAAAAIGSFIAGTIGTIALTFVAPAMAELALKFGPADYFALMIVAFTTVIAVLGRSVTRGFASLLFGLALGCVGLDFQSGQPRFTFGFLPLVDGIDAIIVAVGLFAIGETLYTAATDGNGKAERLAVKGSMWLSRDDWSRCWKPWLRGAAIGFPIGAIPAGGSEIPTFISYAVEKHLAKNPKEFGSGAIEAVAGPEAANNASAAGVLAPMLALGIPTSITAAIMLAAFQRYGIQPGPTLFTSNPDLVWTIIASLYIANVLLVILNLPLAGVWVKLLLVPKKWMYAGILVFATLGAYTINNSVVDLMLLWCIGIVGFGMRCLDIPVAPCVLGFILGPMAEEQFRRAMTISRGDFSELFTRPLSGALLLLAIAVVVLPVFVRWKNERKYRALHAGDDAVS